MHKDRSPLRDTLNTFKPLSQYFGKYRWPLIIGLLSLLAVDFLQLLIPLVIKQAVDVLTIKKATSALLFRYGLVIFGIALLIALLRYVWRILLFGVSRKMEEALRNRLYHHLQSLSYSYYLKTKTGDLMARSINDINAIRMAIGIGMVGLMDGFVLGMAAIGFMIYISPFLTLISLVFAPVIVFLTRILTHRMALAHERVQKTFSDLTERAREAFAGIRVVKAYARESWASGKLRTVGESYISENMDLAKTFSLFFPLMGIFTNLGLVFVIWIGGRLTILGDITTGDFVAFISYLNLLTWPMMAIGWVTNLIQRGAASMRRINHVLDEVPEIVTPHPPKPLPEIHGGILFKDLSLTYPDKNAAALKGINLSIEAGKDVAIVGRVGSGKTTLLHTLPRLFMTSKGMVFIDGVDVHDIALQALRENIGFVTQETFIFSDTVRNNVLFGRSGITEEGLEYALKSAQIYEEVKELDGGWDTLLGERGITLSGGQRQRLTIARALIDDPPILILDDALSMVDTRTEERILNQILTARRDKTNVIVSHRLSTISRADLIVVLDKGEIVEQDDHEALLAKGGEYTRLYERQLLAQELENGEMARTNLGIS